METEVGMARSAPATSSVPAIDARGLAKSFGEVQAVDGVDLLVQRGELFSLLGPNGAGKTTTIKMLCGLLEPTGGSARIFGHDLAHDPLSVKSLIAISPQETAVSGHLNAWENLALMAGLHGVDRATTRRRSGELLELMGLTQRAKDKVRKYSGGMQRRLSIAMALVSDPDLLFLDEPTLGLDPQARRAMWEHIDSLKNEVTIVLTTHYLEEADALADRIAIIDEGRVIARGTSGDLKASISEGDVTVIELDTMSFQAVEVVKTISPNAQTVDGHIEVDGDVDLFTLADALRPMGVSVRSSFKKTVTLDDVFLALTGKQLRE